MADYLLTLENQVGALLTKPAKLETQPAAPAAPVPEKASV
jgi:hypothetical protein